MNVAELLLSRGCPAAPALIEGERVTSHGALRSRVAAVAAWIAHQSLPPGSRVGILAENSAFFASAYLGIIHAGMVGVPLNTDGSPESTDQMLRTAGAAALVASRRQARRMARSAPALSCPVVSEESLPATGDVSRAAAVRRAEDLAALMFTSGSTGAPKGVMVTHGNIACNTRDIISVVGLTESDRALLVLPLHYCFGLSIMHTHLLAGGSLVLNNQFLYPETVWRDIQRHACTGLAGVPSTYQILLRKSRLTETPLPTLRWMQQAGGRLPNPVIKEIRKAQPQARFFAMYGQTEATARLSCLPPECLDDKLGSVGMGLPSTRLEVVAANGQPVRPGSEEIGEIVATGANICAGYWNDSEETSRYFRNGRLHTGDLARVDADGFIFIVDRDRDMIKCGGNRVSTKEIEDVIAGHPEVVEVAVIGLPHDWLGEAISAYVVTTGQALVRPDDLRQLCHRVLPPYKVPEQIHFIAELPHNSSGKVMKHTLRQRALSSPFPLIAQNP